MRNKTLSAARNPATGKLQWDIKAGDILSIDGTGFGSKTESVYYDDFESRTLGAVSNNVGSLNWSSQNGSAISSANPHSGTKSITHNFSVNDFPKVYKNLTGKTSLTLSCWIHISGTVSSGAVWKFARVGAGDVYSGNPKAGASYTSTGTANTPQAIGGEIVINNGDISSYSANVSGITSTPSAAFTNGSWHFYELEFYTGTLNNSDCYFCERVDNKITTQWINRPFLTSTNSAMPAWLLLPINGLDNSPAITYSVDEVYISESRSRIVMTNSATYSASTMWCAQEDLQGGWNDELIYYKPKRGNFTQGETAYLHIFNNGVLVSTKTITVP